MKDYFSGHAKSYAAFRPVYPDDLYTFILRHVTNKIDAWDCGTGNGHKLQAYWGPEEIKSVTFPLFGRVGRVADEPSRF